MTRALDRYNDIHSHDRARALDGDTVVNIEPGQTMLDGGTYSVGIHPWNTDRPITLTQLRQLITAARDPHTVAIGECGFDVLRGGHIDIQQRLFNLHARLAEQTGKPLIIHAVRSYPQLFDAIRRHHPTVEWIIHGFRGKPETARQLVAAGYSLSLGNKYNPDVPAIINPDRLYRETDSPDTTV
ncbi:MAG: TatD family hydrolase [Bacteroidales bacterium]|nr:TatD family hydrolase [Bacteroidales bacterium]